MARRKASSSWHRITGCDARMGPSGPSTSEVKKQIESMPPEKQIQLIQNSPMKPDEKKTKIDEIKQKYNITGDVPAGAPTPGAHQSVHPANNSRMLYS